MERNSFGSNLRNHSIGGRNCSSKLFKGSTWEGGPNDEFFNGEGDLLSGFSWPPRSYTCSFCKREFRSAQALGGHMNVHRRDRARLRQSPPLDHGQYSLLNLNHDPNPNPNLNFHLNPNPNPSPNPGCFPSSSPSSSPKTRFPPFNIPAPPPSLSPSSQPNLPSSRNGSQMTKLGKDNICAPVKHSSPLTADLSRIRTTKPFFDVEKIGCFMHEKECRVSQKSEIVRLDLEIGLLHEARMDLDLELRLGYNA